MSNKLPRGSSVPCHVEGLAASPAALGRDSHSGDSPNLERGLHHTSLEKCASRPPDGPREMTSAPRAGRHLGQLDSHAARRGVSGRGPARLTAHACGAAATRVCPRRRLQSGEVPTPVCARAAYCSLGRSRRARAPFEVALPLKRFCSTRPGPPVQERAPWGSGQRQAPREHSHQAAAEGGEAQRSLSGVRPADRTPAGGHGGHALHTHTCPHGRHPAPRAHVRIRGASTPEVFDRG